MIEHDEVKTLISDYYDWLKSETIITLDTTTEWAYIDTPFYGMYDDAIRLYLKKNNKDYILSDNAVTLNNLQEIGIDFHQGTRKEIFKNLIAYYNVEIGNNNEITMTFPANNFIASKYSMLELILKLADLTYLSKENVKNTFKDDVKEILLTERIRFTQDVSITGRSGLEHKFDFVIPGYTEEILLSTVNKVSTSNLSAFLYSWLNIKENRKSSTDKITKPYLVVNQEDSLNKINTSAMNFEQIQVSKFRPDRNQFISDMKNVA